MASSDAPLPRGLIGRRGTPTGKSTRLPSIRGPRDLTLGGVPKKVFTPNIPVRKDRPKDGSATPSTSRDSQKSDRYERGRGGARARGRGMFTTVQSHSSIFEQGPAERLIPRTARDIFYERKEPGASSSSRVKKKKVDPEEAKRVIDHLLCDDFIDDDDAVKKEDNEEEVELRPIQLPLASLTAKHESKTELGAVDSGKIKVEPKDPDSEHHADVDMTDMSKVQTTTPTFPVKPAPIKPITCQELFSFSTKSDREELLFFQLPDVIPGIPPSKVDDDPRLVDKKLNRQDAASKSNSQTVKKEEKSITEKLGLCSMADFSEGHIGKLQIRKSGRVQLVLGNITLDLEMGTPCGFLQEVVSIKTDVDGGQMTVLGHVNNKVIATPDFDSLLDQT